MLLNKKDEELNNKITNLEKNYNKEISNINKKISKIDNINKDHLKRDLFKKYLNIDMKEASNILKNN